MLAVPGSGGALVLYERPIEKKGRWREAYRIDDAHDCDLSIVAW